MKDLTLSYAKFCSMGEILGVPYNNDAPDQSFLSIIEAITALYKELREAAIEQAEVEAVGIDKN